MQNEKDRIIFTAYEDIEPADSSAPEKSLLLAVLMSAISDLKKSPKLRRKATDFFLSNEDDYIFSFQAICDYLCLNSKRILYITGLKTERNGHK